MYYIIPLREQPDVLFFYAADGHVAKSGEVAKVGVGVGAQVLN
jgi:hypothetical protein